MSRRLLITLAALGVLGLVVGLRAVADPHPQGPAAAPPAVQGTSIPPDPGSLVRWTEGPWGSARLAGSPVLLPASDTEGPLVDHGNGWAQGYAATAVGASIALLRAGLMQSAAPPELHDQVDAATLTDPADAAKLTGAMRNEEPAWTLPAPLVAASQAVTVRLLGVVVEVNADDSVADALVYQAVAGAGDDILTATRYQLAYDDGQWRVQGAADTATVTSAPSSYTLPAPADRTAAQD